MSTAILFAVAAGLCSALPLLIGVVAPGGFLLVILTPLPLFLAGLAHGVSGALIAGVTASAVIGVLSGIVVAASAAMFLAAPVAILVRQALLSRYAGGGATGGGAPGDGAMGGGSVGTARDWYPPGLLVAWLTGIGLLWLAVVFVLQSASNGIEAGLREDLLRSMELILPQAQPDELVAIAEAVTPFVLGSGVVGWLLLLTVNGVLAQGVLTRFGRNLRPAPDLATLTVPTWLTPALGLAAAAALLGSQDLAYIGQNATLVLLLPFFFAGLATIHALTRGLKARTAILVTMYIVLFFFSVWPAVLVAGLGLVEPWLGLRRRFAPAPNQEEE